MKAAIHPTLNDATVTCACGTVFSVATTIKKIDVDICSSCHPFYTGQMKYVDTKGRVDAFVSKLAQVKADRVSKTERRAQKRAAQIEADLLRPDTLAEFKKTIRARAKSK